MLHDKSAFCYRLCLFATTSALLDMFCTTMQTPHPTTSQRIQRIKYDSSCSVRKHGSDAKAIAFLCEHTSIPVPKVLRIQLSGDDNWILMQRIPGTRLDLAWPSMDLDARRKTVTLLRSYMNQLRNMRPPNPGWIGSISKGPAYDHRLNNGFRCGPFTSLSEFHDYLVALVKDCPHPELSITYRKAFSDDYKIIFAHADISYENILVNQRSGDITGILDWVNDS